MARDRAFIEVAVHRGLFSRRGAATKRLELPLSWTANRRRMTRFFGLALVLSALVSICLLVAFVVDPWLGTFGAVFFACVAYPPIRMELSLHRLGPGRITIDGDGFTDDRIGVGRVPWRYVGRSLALQNWRSGRGGGVLLLLDGDRFTKAVSGDYRWAYLPLIRTRRPVLFVDLSGNRDGRGTAEAIRVLIDAAKPD